MAVDRRESGKRATGAQVETLARGFLQAHDLIPVASNANYRGGELDLVMRDDDTLVFVEVRERCARCIPRSISRHTRFRSA